ncbi:pyruvate dehydrogenase (acetyl-transferring) E1 component subunit alpha [Salinimicrobium sp. TH3]|uniref:pyruvate dehydrogenase (acetyl-transferring) E1 component subunit alpha n=1 Tax=Salinimicrobium sp. TH3 TaxID=2997342 RepID=UPI002274F01E|nr:pyruvate dehydrogenase (acetyl-transferring) E1 component subunit alpha [Salinimicrobium sp. TH3]MCY2685879.1 pyruvate dehydrogenase (acetyl-transferring) E1 component subunit alpha [Salinimicrobium sp. TH3]
MENQKNIEPQKAADLLYQMLLMRKFEEKSAELYTKEKIRGFLHLYIGEEAVATGVIQTLKPEDYILGTYREHAHALARGVDAGAIMAEMYGKQEGCSRGRGGSMHLFDKEKNFFGGNAIVSGHLPMATGMALASKKLKKGNITVCFFGEGAAAEGEFHEALNLASLWKVPVLFVCENNLYAMGTALRYSHSMQELEKKGQAYGIESAAVDGMDLLRVMEAATKAVDLVRSTGNPYLLVCNTYRFRAHSMFDAELYRDKAEVEEWKKRDPIPQFREYLLKENLINEEQIGEMEERLKQEIQKAVDFAEAGTWEPEEDLGKFVYTQNSAS